MRALFVGLCLYASGFNVCMHTRESECMKGMSFPIHFSKILNTTDACGLSKEI